MTIDWWTLGLQTVNVVILIWLLRRFFWRPVAATIEQRRASAQSMLAEAEAKQSAATAALAANQQMRAHFDQERDAMLNAAREAAEQARNDILKEAAKAADALQSAAKEEIDKERQAADEVWAEKASHLAVDIAERLVARLDSATVREAFLQGLLTAIRALPASTRQSAASNVSSLEVVSAAALDSADQDRYRRLVGDAFGADPQTIFNVDPALIAGVELHGAHFIVTNSWHAELVRILTELQHEHR